MKPIAIVDNTVLSDFFKVGSADLFDKLRLIFSTVYVPTEVKKEVAGYQKGGIKQRTAFVGGLRTENGFYRLCNTFDLVVLAMLDGVKGIDKGEREAISQALKIPAFFILTDDKRCIAYIEKTYPQLRCMGLPEIIYKLESTGMLPNWKEILLELSKLNNYTVERLENAYTSVCKELGKQIGKKQVREMTRLD